MNVSPSNSELQESTDRHSEVTLQGSNRKRVSPSNIQSALTEDVVGRLAPLNGDVIEPPEGSGTSDASTDSIEYFDVIPKSEVVTVVFCSIFKIIQTIL